MVRSSVTASSLMLVIGCAHAGAEVVLQNPVSEPEMATMATVNIVSAGAADGTTEGSGSYTSRALSVGGKTARDPKQIQQSVSVITEQRIRDQGLTTTEDALRQTPGVTLTQNSGYSTSSTFSARGFSMGIQRDGGAPDVSYSWGRTGLPDLAAYDSVEVLRGSDGLYGGSGNPGGTVNLVRKRALNQPQVVIDVAAGSWDNTRVMLDATAPLGFDGALRGRVVAVQEKLKYFYENADSNKTVLYGVLEADLTPSTLLSVGFSHELQDRHGIYRGLPRYSTGETLDLPRDACLCTDWSERQDDNREVFAKIEQKLGDDWRLRLNVSKQQQKYNFQDGYVAGAVNPVSGTGSTLQANGADVSGNMKLADLILDGRFKLLGIEQELVAGFNWQDMFVYYDSYRNYSAAPSINIFSFDSDGTPRPAIPGNYKVRKPYGGQVQTGVYATVRTNWTTHLHTIVGARLSSFESNFTSGNSYYEESNILTPYAGVNYDLTKNTTVYASYAEIYRSQAGSMTEAREPLKAIEGKTFEIGVKHGWLNDKLMSSFALYQVKRKNASVRVSTPADEPNCCYAALAEIDSRGVDTELTGQLLPGWQVSVGYTFNLNKNNEGYGSQNGTRASTTTPKHMFKLWNMAQLGGALSSVRVGGGVNWQSDNYVTGTAATFNSSTNQFDGPSMPFQYVQNGYAIASLRTEYKLSPRWSIAVNANNIFDKAYFQTVSTSNSGNFVGEPRNFTFTLHGIY